MHDDELAIAESNAVDRCDGLTSKHFVVDREVAALPGQSLRLAIGWIFLQLRIAVRLQ